MKPEVIRALENMKKRGYIVHTFDTPEEMRDFVVWAIQDGESVGFGGSLTVRDLGVFAALKERGIAVYHHWAAEGEPPRTPEEMAEQQKKAHAADNYIMSANAISENGMMLNIGGNGNRIAALANGPKVVYILVGENKFVGTEEDALERCRKKACPENSRRLNRMTPCAGAGYCSDCSSPGRICNNAMWTWHVPQGREYHICVAPGELGL